MKKLFLLLPLVWLLGLAVSTQSHAAKCAASGPGNSLSDEEMTALYECLRPKFVKAFGKKDHSVGSAYGDWKAVSTRPAAPGVHSGQYLMTYVNEIGHDQYVEFRTDGSKMPIGTVIAKENFTIKDSGKVKWGPLLIMTKVDEAEAPDTGGWVYSGAKTNGKKLKVDSKGFCHACHQAWPTQDFMGYPIPAVRVAAE